MADPVSNFGTCLVQTGSTIIGNAANGVTIKLAAGLGADFPSGRSDYVAGTQFNVRLTPDGQRPTKSNSEIVRCTGVGDVLTATARGQEGTTPKTTIDASWRVEAVLTAAYFDSMKIAVRLDDPRFGAQQGVTTFDNSAAFAAAFAVCGRGTGNGGTVIVPSGDWYIQKPIYIPQDCGLVGEASPGGSYIWAGAGFVGGAMIITGSDTSKAFTLASGTPGVFTCNAHGYSNTNQVRLLTLTGGAGLVTPALQQIYYIVNSTTNTFQLALTSGGTPINVTTNGSGTVRLRVAGAHQYIRNLFIDGAWGGPPWNADQCVAFIDCGTPSEMENVFCQRGDKRIATLAGSGEVVFRNCTFANPNNGDVVWNQGGGFWWFGGCIEGPSPGFNALTIQGIANYVSIYGLHMEGPRVTTGNALAAILIDSARMFEIGQVSIGYTSLPSVYTDVIKITNTQGLTPTTGLKGTVGGIFASAPPPGGGTLLNDTVNGQTRGGTIMGRYDMA